MDLPDDYQPTIEEVLQWRERAFQAALDYTLGSGIDKLADYHHARADYSAIVTKAIFNGLREDDK